MRNRRVRSATRQALFATTAMLALNFTMHAQDGDAADDGLRLDTVEVSATMRDQSLQDVPISVNVVGGDTLDEFNFETFDDLDRMVPNLVISDTPGNNEIYIRGIGTASGNLAFEQSVGMFVDGMYGGRARLFQTPFLDIERIEVLRGPQGALVGKNTAAGAISVITRKPTDEFEMSLTGEYETEFESTAVTGVISGPLSDQLKARLAVKTSDQGGFVFNQTKGTDEPASDLFAARLTAVFDATENVKLTGKLDYAKADHVGVPYETIAVGDSPDYVKESDNTLVDEKDQTESLIALLDTEIALGEHVLKLITAYGDLESINFVDSSFTAAPSLGSTFFDDYSQFSQEVRLISPTDQTFEYIVGALHLDQEVDIRRQTFFNFGPFNGNDDRVYNQTSEVISVFGQGTWNFSDTLRGIASLRYTTEDKSADLVRTNAGGLIPALLAPGTPALLPLSGDLSEDQVDPSVTLQWDATPDAMLYATYAKGSKGGGFAGASSNANAGNFEFSPEESESFEVGAKLTLMDGRANLNAAAFSTEYTDLQVSTFNGVAFDFGNAASAEARGLELEGVAQLTEGVSINGAIAYLDTTYQSYPAGACVSPDHIIPGCVADLSGTTLANAPEWSGTFGINAEGAITENLLWRGNLGATFRSDYFTHPTLFENSKQDAHSKIDLRVAIGNANDTWELALVGKNITDEETIGQAFETPFSAPPGNTPDHFSVTVLPERPRTVALQFTIRN
ncbi:MAG: TonB-dependent receptor [Henriciella sp.]